MISIIELTRVAGVRDGLTVDMLDTNRLSSRRNREAGHLAGKARRRNETFQGVIPPPQRTPPHRAELLSTSAFVRNRAFVTRAVTMALRPCTVPTSQSNIQPQGSTAACMPPGVSLLDDGRSSRGHPVDLDRALLDGRSFVNEACFDGNQEASSPSFAQTEEKRPRGLFHAHAHDMRHLAQWLGEMLDMRCVFHVFRTRQLMLKRHDDTISFFLRSCKCASHRYKINTGPRRYQPLVLVILFLHQSHTLVLP